MSIRIRRQRSSDEQEHELSAGVTRHRIIPGTGEPAVVPQDSTRPCASGADGWQFSEDKKKIVLCGSACNAVNDDTRSKFNVGFGCKTIVR
jgi:hypothetical protein